MPANNPNKKYYEMVDFKKHEAAADIIAMIIDKDHTHHTVAIDKLIKYLIEDGHEAALAELRYDIHVHEENDDMYNDYMFECKQETLCWQREIKRANRQHEIDVAGKLINGQ